MICKICKTDNEPDSKYCISCGSPLLTATKICQNGHVYDSSLSRCPYCPSPDLKNKMGISDGSFSDITESISSISSGDSKTRIVSNQGSSKGKKTMIVGAEGEAEVTGVRPKRAIVGWLITFSWKKEGEDFKLYEGRNLISADASSDIHLSDPAISTPHCMILYRAGKFIIKDELSTNGTFLNGNLIEENELKDGDTIKVGTTELKLRTVN